MLTVQPEPFLKDIDGRIDIAVVFRPASGAGPVPDAHVLQLRIDLAAYMADLAGREPSADFDEYLPTVMQLVFQEAEEHPVTVVHSSPAVPEVFVRHCFHIQIFHTDDVVRIGCLRRLLVAEIQPLVRDVAVYFRDAGFLLLMVSGAFLLVTESSLLLCQEILRFTGIFR